eukprot:365940-Chlamydomonas_euryale.AAC.23
MLHVHKRPDGAALAGHSFRPGLLWPTGLPNTPKQALSHLPRQELNGGNRLGALKKHLAALLKDDLLRMQYASSAVQGLSYRTVLLPRLSMVLHRLQDRIAAERDSKTQRCNASFSGGVKLGTEPSSRLAF